MFLTQTLQLLYYAYFNPSALQVRMDQIVPQEHKHINFWELSVENIGEPAARRFLLQCFAWWLLGLLPLWGSVWGTTFWEGLFLVSLSLFLTAWILAFFDLPLSLVFPMLASLIWINQPEIWVIGNVFFSSWLNKYLIGLLATDFLISLVLGGGTALAVRLGHKRLGFWWFHLVTMVAFFVAGGVVGLIAAGTRGFVTGSLVGSVASFMALIATCLVAEQDDVIAEVMTAVGLIAFIVAGIVAFIVTGMVGGRLIDGVMGLATGFVVGFTGGTIASLIFNDKGVVVRAIIVTGLVAGGTSGFMAGGVEFIIAGILIGGVGITMMSIAVGQDYENNRLKLVIMLLVGPVQGGMMGMLLGSMVSNLVGGVMGLIVGGVIGLLVGLIVGIMTGIMGLLATLALEIDNVRGVTVSIVTSCLTYLMMGLLAGLLVGTVVYVLLGLLSFTGLLKKDFEIIVMFMIVVIVAVIVTIMGAGILAGSVVAVVVGSIAIVLVSGLVLKKDIMGIAIDIVIGATGVIAGLVAFTVTESFWLATMVSLGIGLAFVIATLTIVRNVMTGMVSVVVGVVGGVIVFITLDVSSSFAFITAMVGAFTIASVLTFFPVLSLVFGVTFLGGFLVTTGVGFILAEIIMRLVTLPPSLGISLVLVTGLALNHHCYFRFGSLLAGAAIALCLAALFAVSQNLEVALWAFLAFLAGYLRLPLYPIDLLLLRKSKR